MAAKPKSPKTPSFTTDQFYDTLATLREAYRWEIRDGGIRGLKPGFDPVYTTSFIDPLAAVGMAVLNQQYRSTQPFRISEDLRFDWDTVRSIGLATHNLPDGSPPAQDLFAQSHRSRLLAALGLEEP